jgi:hypothetical protein
MSVDPFLGTIQLSSLTLLACAVDRWLGGRVTGRAVRGRGATP